MEVGQHRAVMRLDLFIALLRQFTSQPRQADPTPDGCKDDYEREGERSVGKKRGTRHTREYIAPLPAQGLHL